MRVENKQSGPSRTNLMGLTRNDYKGRPTTLCQGCGHNSIASQIMAACYENSIPPEKVIKISGIGCSSKSPAYFMSRSHGFNSLHGRMPSIATGAVLVNRELIAIGVSGDGDTASIGIGQFIHLLRRNLPMVYIVENNGVYGLTKGQFSATADKVQVLKKIGENPFFPVDVCMEALIANCGFVARSFAGDPKQVKELIKAALSFNGTAVLDIISPCVTFNNRDESTKSYAWGKEHEIPIHDVTFVPRYDEIAVDYEPGEGTEVELHDGSTLMLKKLEQDYDPTDRKAAIMLLEETRARQVLATGLIYINKDQPPLQEVEELVDTPLTRLREEDLRPSPESLLEVLESFR
ncbi:MAG: 2-oxoglutarate ferredoxin oxidoreductase subunit beta [Chloroflexi bacterium RBG_16_48_8]|nr:MAG: 2-oxoglutarate ferredoxin oxidoreductase subunit beta [Chloroflexi bacterium RBG_16_48_8]